MSSRDNYLDELLEEMPLREDEGEEHGAQRTERPGVEALSEMTEEEIDRLLAAGAESAGDESGSESQGLLRSEDPSRGDVLDMLEGTGDRDLREIQDLLKKSDRKENIKGEDPDSENLGGSGNPVDRLLADIDEAGENEVATDAMDGRHRRALKKEQRRAQKEEKKRTKQAAKAAKNKAGREENVPRKQEREASVPKEYNMMSDKELLDSIVSGAGLFGKQESSKGQEPSEDGGQELFGDGKGSMADLLSFAQADLDASEDREAEWVEGQSATPARDIIAVDMNEADSMLTDISQKPEEGKHRDGLLSKFVSFLTEEDDEPEGENEDVQLSEENEEILKDLENEKPQKGKGKKAKKKPEKKAKKEKKAKPSKPPKPKKQKKPREPEPYPLGKRLTFKKALPVILFGVSLGLVIFIVTGLSTDYMGKQTAREAYEAGDYEACYQNLFGKKLNDDEAVMYGRSESILYIRQWLKEYEMLAEKGAEVEALDSLIQSVKDYPGLYEYASKWKAGMDIYEVYLEMLDILSGKYGITETQALQIAGIKSDLEYTRVVTALAQGEDYGSGTGQEGTGSKAEQNQTRSTVTEWYESDERSALEAQINQTLAQAGLVYYIEVQEPDTVVYNYQYREPLDKGAATAEELEDYYGTLLDGQYAVFAESIREFRDVYGIPLNVIRIRYLDADGTVLFTQDFTEDYAPEGSAGEALPDALPEESEIGAGNFVGNE